MAKIHILEDDENIRGLICYALASQGFDAVGYERAAGFIDAVKADLPDLVILDIMLPDEDGLSVLKKIRADAALEDIPVIMLTAKSSEFDKVKGLDSGADDYMAKPFSVLELISRINAHLRRRAKKSVNKTILSSHNVTIDLDKRMVNVGTEAVNLTLKEFELLRLLMENEGKVVSRDRIIEVVWGWDFEGESRTVDVHVKTLRQKMGEMSKYIETVRGVGYRFGE
ncbi:MAG: response regulator transcription factor [Clostridia bacterium]|nr:response regulator transcription factor [Clostridia bacterium]